MKYFVVTVRSKPGETTCYYPDNYGEILTRSVADKYFEENGEFKRLHLIPDNLAKEVKIVRPDVVEVNQAEADRIGLINEAEEVINDQAKIKRIEIKVGLGQQLTPDEIKAIDPDDSTPGIVKRKKFTDKIADLKMKETKGAFLKEKYA